MERVTREEVIRSWLAREREGTGETDERSADEAFDALLTENPGAAAFLWRDAPVDCYRLDLSRSHFESLRVVYGPEGLGWRALSPDGTIAECARRIDREDTDELARETGIDVPLIERLARDGPASEYPLVLCTRKGAVPWHVADGNHRAVATALTLERGASYEPVSAYLCVGANPVFRPLIERFRGIFGRR